MSMYFVSLNSESWFNKSAIIKIKFDFILTRYVTDKLRVREVGIRNVPE